MRVPIALAFFLVLFSSFVPSQTFKQHNIGETAQQFFSVATVTDNKGPTVKYCADYLSNPKVQKAYEKAQRNTLDTQAMIQSFDVDGCLRVQKALEGKDVEVGARYAAELGKGSVNFHASKLALIVLDVEAAPIEDVITDISKELGGTQPSMSTETVQNGFGATLQRRKALWNTNNLTVAASEMNSFQYGHMGVSVVVADTEYLRQKEAERQGNRPSTIH